VDNDLDETTSMDVDSSMVSTDTEPLISNVASSSAGSRFIQKTIVSSFSAISGFKGNSFLIVSLEM